MINRTQLLVLGFFILVWIGLAAILALSPDVYAQTLKLRPGNRGPAELAFLAALTAVIVLLATGVLRRWRWTFWLIMVAFIVGGVLRVPASILQFVGVLPRVGPAWYVLLQGGIGLAQCAVGLALFAGYRKAGTWGAF